MPIYLLPNIVEPRKYGTKMYQKSPLSLEKDVNDP